jgi:uncharacterized repeat protein (TIGR01451 family)
VARPQIKHPNHLHDRWLLKLAIIFFLGGILQHFSDEVAQAQPDTAVRPPLLNQATYSYSDPASSLNFSGSSGQLNAAPDRLVDPLGRILGCGGQILPDYAGFLVSLHEINPGDPTQTDLGSLVPLTRTELPDISENGVPGGISPNRENKNPFLLSNAVTETERGVYNFLLDPAKGQLNPGRTYIFVVNPPANSVYQQRRIKIQIIDSTGTAGNNIVRYVATSLDGQPISITGDTRVEATAVSVTNAELIGLDLLAFQFTTQLCQPDQAQIVKTGDRASAEPGDSVIYRLSVRSRTDADLKDVTLTDTLPLGFRFLPNSMRGEIEGQVVAIGAETRGSTVIFRSQTPIPSGKVLNVAYAAQLTPDAIRGSGRNSAIVNARRSDNGFRIQDGPATHQLRIRQGILSDCGVIIGRVFIDKNFDGEQQSGELGVPNAVIFLDDGNRISTDVNGLFSVANVLPGYRSGVLDLASVPGYTFAPNTRFSERNSQSRLVHLAPGELVRMNFAIAPSLKEAVQK